MTGRGSSKQHRSGSNALKKNIARRCDEQASITLWLEKMIPFEAPLRFGWLVNTSISLLYGCGLSRPQSGIPLQMGFARVVSDAGSYVVLSRKTGDYPTP